MKSGFIALIGRPNVGKSTLMNAILQKKISIISPKPQTTRNAIQGIYSDEGSQMIFVDTPGIHKPSNHLGEWMNKEALGSIRGVEAVILLVDASLPFGEGDQYVIDHLKTDCPIFIVANKIDLCSLAMVEELKKIYKEKLPMAKFIEISALKDVQIQKLLDELKMILPEGPQYFPEGVYSNHPESFIIAELIREKILSLLQEEVPHSVAVIIEKLEKKKDVTNISATIICEKEGQKGIIIGRNGKMIKRIGMQARYDIEQLLGIHCRLETFVRVEKDWRNSARYLKEFGYGKGSAG